MRKQGGKDNENEAVGHQGTMESKLGSQAREDKRLGENVPGVGK